MAQVIDAKSIGSSKFVARQRITNGDAFAPSTVHFRLTK
jgi:hypothetical protein